MDVFKSYVKPFLNHKFKTTHATHRYDKPLGEHKPPAPKYLSKTAKSLFPKILNEAKREENRSMDFLRVNTSTTSENAWEADRKKRSHSLKE